METRLSLVFLKNTMRTWSPSMFLLIGKILSLSFVNITMEIMSLLYYLLNRGIMSLETMSPSAMGIRTYSLMDWDFLFWGVIPLNILKQNLSGLDILRNFGQGFIIRYRKWVSSIHILLSLGNAANALWLDIIRCKQSGSWELSEHCELGQNMIRDCGVEAWIIYREVVRFFSWNTSVN